VTNLPLRRQRRYSLVNPELVQAAILPKDSTAPGEVVAELREISKLGAKLLVTGPPELRYECRISLKSHRLKRVFDLPSEIHWARPDAAGDWLLGCRFATPLSDEAFQDFLDSGVLNRRSSVRERSRIPVQVQLQPGQARLPAIVSDFSEGGLCLTTSEAPHSTRHVCVFGSISGREVRIPLKVRWTLAVGPNRFAGCQFMRAADYQVLRTLHLQTQQEPLNEHAHAGCRNNRTQPICQDAGYQTVEPRPTDVR
jgi:hypothetical protein